MGVKVKPSHYAMRVPNYGLYLGLRNELDDRIAIGGSTALVVRGELPSNYTPGDLDLCIEHESQLSIIDSYLTQRGWVKSIDLPNGNAFTVRRQYKLDGEKVDFFLIPDLDRWVDYIDGNVYVKSQVIWAARGYYAGVGSEKAQQQLVTNGMIRPFVPNSTPNSKLSKRQVIRRIIGDIKHLIKSIL